MSTCESQFLALGRPVDPGGESQEDGKGPAGFETLGPRVRVKGEGENQVSTLLLLENIKLSRIY